MNRSPRPMIAPALLAAVLVAACQTLPPQSTPAAARVTPLNEAASHLAAPNEVGHASIATAAAESDRPRYTEADVHFMQGMIAHHAQAMAMTSLVPEHTSSDDIHLLAERIRVSQRDEIALMQNWLRKRSETVPSADTTVHRQTAGDHATMPGMPTDMDHDALMPGMLTDEQMAQLVKATGAAFDRLFLRFMIQHHEGALTMVGKLFATQGAAQEPEVFRFASDVDSDQQMEIERMRAMLAAQPAGEPRH